MLLKDIRKYLCPIIKDIIVKEVVPIIKKATEDSLKEYIKEQARKQQNEH